MPTTDVQTLDIYIDGNIWNLLYDHNIDLLKEFPRTEFRLLQTKEAEIENIAIPEDKEELKLFIFEEIERCSIETIALFGFDNQGTPESLRRYNGFNDSIWASPEMNEFRESETQNMEIVRASGLFHQEGDISVAARSLSSLVLTLNSRKGPLTRVQHMNGQVIFLKNFKPTEISLRDYVFSNDG